jgi:formamidopyrimidine-DNA glycosylase
MDQEIIAGIGNIYSDEILFQTRIYPAARMDTLPPSQVKKLYLTMREVLETGDCSWGRLGTVHRPNAQGRASARAQEGRSLSRCGSALKIFKVGGRTAYCCPQCKNC